MSKIGEINKLISRCNSCQDIQTAERLKQDAILLLTELECSNKIMQRCRDISFGNAYSRPFGGTRIDALMEEESRKENLELELVSMLDLLSEVKAETVSYSLQHKAMIYSAIAAIGTLVSIGITILLHYI